MYDAVIISDLHLGAPICQARLLEAFLDGLPFTRRLILNGDVLDGCVERLTKHHWRVLSRLRKLSDMVRLVWVAGNHDADAQALAVLIGARFLPEYAFHSGLRKILCLHGDRFDDFLTDHPFLTWWADQGYLLLQRVSPRLARLAKVQSKTFLHNCAKVRGCALDYARAREADSVCCGHTHHAEGLPSPRVCNPPEYWNSGSWTEDLCPYLTVEGGRVLLHSYEEAVDGRQEAA
jgi:UDP-2,3-diacylglucosamine pyrophosphatase LpxH